MRYGRGEWGRKDAFPGADGSTIEENGNATTIPLYGTLGNNVLTEGESGLTLVNITTSGVLDKNNSQVYAIKNPLAIIYNTTTPWDWYTTSASYQNDTLWISSLKSRYDPCPKGWRVPATGTWNDFSLTTFPASGSGTNIANGRTYNKTAWFSAGGYRGYSSGALYYIGINGATWSSSVNEINAMALGFTLSGIGPSNAYIRARGFPIRCVQE